MTNAAAHTRKLAEDLAEARKWFEMAQEDTTDSLRRSRTSAAARAIVSAMRVGLIRMYGCGTVGSATVRSRELYAETEKLFYAILTWMLENDYAAMILDIPMSNLYTSDQTRRFVTDQLYTAWHRSAYATRRSGAEV